MLKSIQQTLILALCILMPAMANAGLRSAEEAKQVAAEFFQSGDVNRLADKDAFTLVRMVNDGSLNPVCYVFNAKDGKGFVVVSASDEAVPVIGYSATSVWDTALSPSSAESLLNTPVFAEEAGFMWPATRADGEVVLATPSWSQEAPFNGKIPNRRLTGCVGVALAEILKYHSYPAVRPSSLSGSETDAYQWSVMRNDNYRSGYSLDEGDAVATLMADAAIAIGTDFGMSSSSAFEVKVPYALTSMFGYDAGVSYKKLSELNIADWVAILKNEIDEGRPVLFSGQDVSAGHAFVCDGYDSNGMLHFNWGWGGSANGFFRPEALNPVVSKAHSYNNLQTIVYNIKPAANSMEWSPIHITSDERQAGLTTDAADIQAAGSFSVRAGALKNISNTDFSGELAVALFNAAGSQKALLNSGRKFSLQALQVSKYVDFSCQVPSGTSVDNGDVVRLVTRAGSDAAWLPVSGDLLAPGEMLAKDARLPYCTITLPDAGSDFELSDADTKVIKGRDYSFRLVPTSVDKVVTVKANGFILSPDASNVYKVANVLDDQVISVNVQNAADVLSKSTLWVEAGNLQNLLDDNATSTVVDLTLFGTMNANDFNFIREKMKLNRLDISQVSIVALGANPANAIPAKAFSGYRSLKTIILPSRLTTLKNGCFNNTGLTSIEIPASVTSIEYNIFVNCRSLKEVIARRSIPTWINWCVFSGCPMTKLVVPVGATAAYQAKEYWQDFKEIVEENPVAANSFKVSVAEKKGLNFTALTEGTEFAPGSEYRFTVESDDSFGDALLQVYSNASRLTPDANGVYKTNISTNTLIHVEAKYPEPTTPDDKWKLAGPVGLTTSVVNVPVGQTFVVRANSIQFPYGDAAVKAYAIVLTDKDGGIKEFISPVFTNFSGQVNEIKCNFNCMVKESTVREGNQIRLATSYNKKVWNLVEGVADSIKDRFDAIGNKVEYHNVTMPESVTGARIEGRSSEVVHGMPFNFKVSAIDPAQRVTVAVNGEILSNRLPVANVSIPAVMGDLDVTVLVSDAEVGDVEVINIQEGTLAAKLQGCSSNVKLSGTMLVSEFDAIRDNITTIVNLDMADVTIKGAAMTGNSIPENAFAPKVSNKLCALRNITLPNNLERISNNAFARCLQIEEITIPANVSYIGNGAFSTCVKLKKIIAKPKVAPTCGSTSPWPSNVSGITLEVPKGSEESYSLPSTWWQKLTIYQAPADAVDVYWVKLDNTRIQTESSNVNLSRVEVGSSTKKIELILPNAQQNWNCASIRRPGVAFKLYDNGVDVFSANASGVYNDQYSQYAKATPNNNPNSTGGRLHLRWIPDATSGPWVPQNHELELVFYYSLNFETKEGAGGVKAELVEIPEDCTMVNVAMDQFKYSVPSPYNPKVSLHNEEVKPILYREGSVLKFMLSATDSKTDYVVKCVTNVFKEGGANPVYEEQEVTLEPENGIYTIPALNGDTWIRISGERRYDEGDAIPAEKINSLEKENVEDFTELTVTGNLSDEAIEAIHEKFESLESLDLSGIENTSLPANAFEGMDQLKDVIVSENVTEIGEGCFKGCENIESLTLPGVTSIGEGAFEGCSSLKSIIIPSAGGQSATRAGEDGITAASFAGLNPNCLIYIGDTSIPDSDHLNIILNENGTRVAASDIILDGDYPFNAPASFNLGDHRISFTAHIPASNDADINSGWTGLMLPFTPTGMEYGVEFAHREGTGLNLLSFSDEEAETLTHQQSVEAYRPYLAHVVAPFSSVPVTFYATANGDAENYDLMFSPTPEELFVKGKNFTLYGSLDGESVIGECLGMNEEGSEFARTDEEVDIHAFSAYLVANDDAASSLAIGNHPVWVVEPVASGSLTGYRGDLVEVTTPKKDAVIYYTIDGSDPTDENGSRIESEGGIVLSDDVTVNVVAIFKGYASDVVSFDLKLKKADVNYNLAQNWNWISHNMEKAVAVADFADKGVSRILSLTQETVNDPKHGFVGNLKELLPIEGYKVCVADEAWKGNISGVAFNPKESVKLVAGWNWIGCPADDASLLVSDLLANLEVEEGEMLVGLEGFVQVDADGAWQGDLSSFAPGSGYMFYSKSDKEFTYNLVAPAQAEPATPDTRAAHESPWVVDIHRYPSVMPATVVLVNGDGIEADAAEYEVVAFCGDECRGVGVLVNGVVMVNIHGVAGDNITFRFLNPKNEEKVSATSVVFSEIPMGTITEPFEVSLVGSSAVESIVAGEYDIVSENGAITIKGDVSGIESVEVYDLSGNKLAASKGGNGNITLKELEAGVKLIVIRAEGTVRYAKVMVK